MLPKPKYRKLNSHKYTIDNFDILKLSSVYGANGSGKSNLFKALKLFQDIVTEEKLPSNISKTQFKFRNPSQDDSQLLAIEFFQGNQAFYYALEILKDAILTEELYISGLGKKEDQLIFERKFTKASKTKITFFSEFEKNKETAVLKNVIEKSFLKPNKPLLKFLTTLEDPLLEILKPVYSWFYDTLQIINPNSKPSALAHRLDVDKEFKKYAENTMCSFHVGIKSITTEKISLSEIFKENSKETIDKLIKDLEESPNKMIGLQSSIGNDEIILMKEEDKIIAKQLKLEHVGKDGITAMFGIDEESDGTVRLLDFIPAFRNIVSDKKVFVIDEIERSIHPLLIKELIKKFSLDDSTNGQLIFTTHETNLLDQDIFRQDEVWFAEKDNNGATDLYSLSDFKEHNTIDIRKGYLNGRYGSIPFLSNLQDLNWQKHASKKQNLRKATTK